ncbi:MAG TPA: type II 3-dehydroquinate dehydratase [Sphingomicrobium sp.]|nr:type II 3-dehydroquinate dehydratase [Sphingomicrobium sp.]
MPTPVIFVLNGPNLNLAGSREPRLSGAQTLDEIRTALDERARKLGVTVDFRQSNHEGQLIDWLQEALAKASAVILNAGGYSHTSIAIRDAVAALQAPVIEVHLSNVYAREHFRRQSFIAQVARASIAGLGPMGYLLALDAVAQLCKGAGAKATRQIQ